ncbi:MAG: GAF domain-containing protein [Minicystis sp.]
MGGVVTHLSLGPLGIEAMVALLADVLRCEPERARPLAGLFLARTGGNPFFTRQLLRSLQHDGLLAFDEAQRTWTWDLRRLEHIGITENVAELMTTAIRRLAPEAQQLLQIAACVGKRVSLPSLVAVRGESLDETTARLGEALREGLLVPDDEHGDDAELGFRFVHDRVQQAAYRLLSDERRKRLHLHIGRCLLHLFGEHAGKLFDIVDQLNLGAELVTEAERLELARLNHRAGVEARRSAAHGPALAYFRAGLAPLSADTWRAHHDLAFLLHRDAAECASLTGDHALCRALVAEGLRHVTSIVEAADLEALRIASATVTAEYESALRWGREASQTLFGSRWPEAGFDEEIAAQREAIGALLAGRSPEDLVNQPLMTSPEDRSYLKLVAIMLAPAWFADRQLLMLLTASSVRFALEHGACCESILPHGVYATLVVGMGETRAAVGWSRLAMGLARRFDDHAQEARAFQLYNSFVKAWVEPLSACAAGARRVFEMGLQWGELQQAAYGRAMLVIYSFVAGIELDRILADVHEGLVFCRQIGSESQISNQLAYQQAIRCLKGLTRSPAGYDDDEFDEPTFLSAARHDPSVACLYHIVRLQTSYLFRDLAEASAQAEAAARDAEFLRGYIPFAEHTFYAALTLLAQPDGTGGRLALVSPLQQRLRGWEEGCPENFRHKRLLVDAEIARVEGRVVDAGRLYDRAIEAAAKAGFVQDAALANELSGRFYGALDLSRVGDMYLRAAAQGWARWGALGKARALDEEFALGLDLALPGRAAEGSAPAAIQALSLLKAAETISSEIVLDRLLGKLMEVCIQAAGAVLGVFVVEEEEGPFVRAIGHAVEPVSTERTPLAQSAQIPREVIEHVRTTRSVLVIDDASKDPRFASDPYIAGGPAKSILVLPIQRKDALLGTFFFANDLTTRAFTREHVRVLELLSAEIAIAVENALLLAKEQAARAAAEDAERRAAFLAEAGVLLSESLDYEETFARLGRLCVRALADHCLIDIVEGREIRRLAVAHADPAKEPLLRELQRRHPPRWDSTHPASAVLRTGTPLLFPEVSDEVLRASCDDDEHFRILREIGTRTGLSVPLVARGQMLGALTLSSGTPGRGFGRADLDLAEEVARRAAIAIDNARLYRASREAARARGEFLTVASHELEHAADVAPARDPVPLPRGLVGAPPGSAGDEEDARSRLAAGDADDEARQRSARRLAHRGGPADARSHRLRSRRARPRRGRALRRRPLAGLLLGHDPRRRAHRGEVGPVPPRPGRGKPPLQRHQVRRRQAHRDLPRRRGRRGAARGPRSRDRHPPGPARPHLRALRARRVGEALRRAGPRPLHQPQDRGRPWRLDSMRESAGRRIHVHHRASGVPNPPIRWPVWRSRHRLNSRVPLTASARARRSPPPCC